MIALETRLRDPKTLDSVLASLEPKIARNIIRRVVRKGANIVRDEARRRAPRQSGLLARDIRTVLRRERGGAVIASVGVMLRAGTTRSRKRLEAFYAKWVERGHRIVPRRGKASRSITLRRREALRVGGRVRPYPFLFPAAKAMQAQVQQVLLDELRSGLLDVVQEGRR